MNLDGSRRLDAGHTREVRAMQNRWQALSVNDRLRALQNGADSDDSDAGEEFFVPESLARDCADDVREVIARARARQRVVGMCGIYQAIAGRNFARSKGKLSPTCIERIIELLRKMGVCDRVIRRILTRQPHPPARHQRDASWASRSSAARKRRTCSRPSWSRCWCSACASTGRRPPDMELTVTALSWDLHCAYTAYAARGIVAGINGYVYDRAAQLASFGAAHRELLGVRAAVVAPMLRHPHVIMDCVIAALARLTTDGGCDRCCS